MRLLLDTHIAIWLITGDDRLSKQASAFVHDTASRLYISPVSVWEVAIKHARNRGNPDDMPFDGRTMVKEVRQSAMEMLPVDAVHAAAVDALPAIHKDPFDRLLIAQASATQLSLLTQDAALVGYGDVVLVV